MEGLGFHLRGEANLESLTKEVIGSSAIEGEKLDAEEVRSSIARHLGIAHAGTTSSSRNVEGVVEMMINATRKYEEALMAERLCSWNAALFPSARSGMQRITVGSWQTGESGPMQVVSGPMGRERVHFEASEASRLDAEISRFLEWFLGCLYRALENAQENLWAILHKARTWERINQDGPVNERQHVVINRLLDGFEGKLSSSKYAKLAKCSPDTALRDIKELQARDILIQEAGGGRSTGYRLVEPVGMKKSA